MTSAETTRSSSPSRMIVTPCEARPYELTCATLVRIRMPPSDRTNSSSSPSTGASVTSEPVFGVTRSVRTPIPPRPRSGYSESFVRLP